MLCLALPLLRRQGIRGISHRGSELLDAIILRLQCGDRVHKCGGGNTQAQSSSEPMATHSLLRFLGAAGADARTPPPRSRFCPGVHTGHAAHLGAAAAAAPKLLTSEMIAAYKCERMWEKEVLARDPCNNNKISRSPPAPFPPQRSQLRPAGPAPGAARMSRPVAAVRPSSGWLQPARP